MSALFVVPLAIFAVILSGLLIGWVAMKIAGENVAKYAVCAWGGYQLAKVSSANELALNVGICVGLALLALIIFRERPVHG